MGAIGFALFSPRRRSATAETKEIVCNTIAHMQQRTIRQAQCARFAFSTRKRRNKSGFSTRPYLRCLSLSRYFFINDHRWKKLTIQVEEPICIYFTLYLYPAERIFILYLCLHFALLEEVFIFIRFILEKYDFTEIFGLFFLTII